MPSEAMTLATDRVPDKATKRCTNCGKPKARDEFVRNRTRRDKLHVHCKQCQRNRMYARYHEGGGKEVQAAYHARPEVKAHRREYDRGRQEDVKRRQREQRRERGATPRGKFLKARSNARERLKRAVTDEQRSRLEARVAACDREIARLDARWEAEREAELPAEPPKARAPRGANSPCRGVYATPAGTFEVKISVGKSKAVRGGTYATVDEARDAANALTFRLKGVKGYVVVREEGRRA